MTDTLRTAAIETTHTKWTEQPRYCNRCGIPHTGTCKREEDR